MYSSCSKAAAAAQLLATALASSIMRHCVDHLVHVASAMPSALQHSVRVFGVRHELVRDEDEFLLCHFSRGDRVVQELKLWRARLRGCVACN